MAYEFTFTPRFQKHFKELTAQEKKRLKAKLELLAENPSHPSLRTKGYKVQPIFLSVVSTWTSVLSGTTKAIK